MTPQEKKRLSYVKDRRNTYGENDKSSRKNLRRKRRLHHRRVRHHAAQTLRAAQGAPDATVEDAVEQKVRGRQSHGVRMRKWPDRPLGEVVEFRLGRRAERGLADPAGVEVKIRRIRRRLRADGG